MSAIGFGIGFFELLIFAVIGLVFIGGLVIVLVLAFERKKNKD